ncbi:CPBP family intramembrane metalloprotease [bacterium]|nr:CPBP family intramembrane metalloprotease [bacterium]
MRWSEIRIIFLQELRDLMKEKVIIFLAIVLPILIYPLILGGVNRLMTTQLNKLEQESLNISLTGETDWLRRSIQESEQKIKVLDVPNPEQALEKNDIHLWVECSPKHGESPVLVMLSFSGVEDLSRQALSKVKTILEDSKNEYITATFNQHGLAYNLDEMIETNIVDISTDRQKSGYLAGKIVPLLMILMILSGASFAAVDLISGEKERGTLETLLLAPIGRESIIWGKFLVVCFIACISAAINLFGIYLTLVLNIMDIPLMKGVAFNLGLSDVVLMMLFTVPMSVLFSAALMIIASYADTFKEGQYYVMPFVLLGMLPAVPALMPNIKLASFICLVPVSSLAIAIKEVLSGIYHWPSLTIAFISSCVYAFFLLRLAARILDRETILPGSRLVIPSESRNYQKQAFILFGIVFLLIYFLGSLVQQKDLIIGLWLTQIFLIALPALLFVRMNRFEYISFLGLRSFRVRQLVAALLFELGLLASLPLIMTFQNWLIPAPKSFFEDFSQALFGSDYPAWVTILTFGLSAGFCEEILFRGTLTGAFSRTWNKWRVVLMVGILFGLLHFNIYRLIPTACIGFVYTYIRLQTGSLFLSIILHTVHNVLLTFLSQTQDTVLHFFVQEFSLTSSTVLGIVFFVGGFFLLDTTTGRKDTVQKIS